MSRYLVIFLSHPQEAVTDATFTDVRAENALQAVRDAKREKPPQHPWTLAIAYSWPMGCSDIDEATRKLASGARS